MFRYPEVLEPQGFIPVNLNSCLVWGWHQNQTFCVCVVSSLDIWKEKLQIHAYLWMANSNATYYFFRADGINSPKFCSFPHWTIYSPRKRRVKFIMRSVNHSEEMSCTASTYPHSGATTTLAASAWPGWMLFWGSQALAPCRRGGYYRSSLPSTRQRIAQRPSFYSFGQVCVVQGCWEAVASSVWGFSSRSHRFTSCMQAKPYFVFWSHKTCCLGRAEHHLLVCNISLIRFHRRCNFSPRPLFIKLPIRLPWREPNLIVLCSTVREDLTFLLVYRHIVCIDHLF